MKIAIVGHVVGNPYAKKVFAEAATALRSAGFEPINPVQQNVDLFYLPFVLHSLPLIAECDGVATLARPETAEAKIQLMFAAGAYIPIKPLKQWLTKEEVTR